MMMRVRVCVEQDGCVMDGVKLFLQQEVEYKNVQVQNVWRRAEK